MPIIGNKEQFNYSQRQWDDLNRILEHNIPLFQLEAVRPSNFGSKMFGLWNVRCGVTVPDLGDIRPWTRWYREENAYVEFIPNKDAICTAWVPDDKDWHNRTILAGLMHSNMFRVKYLHRTDEVSIPEQPISKSLITIYNYLHTWSAYTITPIIIGNRRKNKINTLHESKMADECNKAAEEYLLKNPSAEVRVDIINIKPIQDLIDKYGQRRWILSQEYRQEHIPAMQKLIEKEMAPFQGAREQAAAQIAGSLGVLSKEDLVSIIRQVIPEIMTAQEAARDPAPVTPEEGEGEAINIDEIQNMGTLRQVARQIGLKVRPSVSKTELKKLIHARRKQLAEEKVTPVPMDESDTDELEAVVPGEEIEVR